MSIRVTIEANIMRIALVRPEKKNAITNAMYGLLAEALRRAETDVAVRVVLFEADGDAFTAGNDLNDFAAVATGKVAAHELHVHSFLEALAQGEKPYVAAVHGLAVGIGVTLLMHCDLVYVAEDARLSTPFVNLALVPEAASSWLLPARIGHARAFAMFALGDSIDGVTAVRLGLANEAFLAADDVKAKAWAAALTLANKPIGALRATKRLMRDAEVIAAVMAKEIETFSERLSSAEAQEAFRAFAERRAPDFRKLQ
jgi:enoyl-CoA hydratase/carnithine racemase